MPWLLPWFAAANVSSLCSKEQLATAFGVAFQAERAAAAAAAASKGTPGEAGGAPAIPACARALTCKSTGGRLFWCLRVLCSLHS